LGKIGDAMAVKALTTTLKDSDRDVRVFAAQALGKIGDKRAVEALMVSLKDKDPQVRSFAAQALGQIGDARATEPLKAALKDKDLGVRERAAWSLERTGRQPVDDTQRASLALAARKWDELRSLGSAAVEPLVVAIADQRQFDPEMKKAVNASASAKREK
jgi:HEAT repeat protein